MPAPKSSLAYAPLYKASIQAYRDAPAQPLVLAFESNKAAMTVRARFNYFRKALERDIKNGYSDVFREECKDLYNFAQTVVFKVVENKVIIVLAALSSTNFEEQGMDSLRQALMGREEKPNKKEKKVSEKDPNNLRGLFASKKQ